MKKMLAALILFFGSSMAFAESPQTVECPDLTETSLLENTTDDWLHRLNAGKPLEFSQAKVINRVLSCFYKIDDTSVFYYVTFQKLTCDAADGFTISSGSALCLAESAKSCRATCTY